MTMRRSLYCLMSIALLAVAAPQAQPAAPAAGRARGTNMDRAAKIDVAASPALSTIAQLSLSDRLADWGMRNGDAVALIQAAKIRKGLPVEVGNTGPHSADALLARAESMSGGNAVMHGLMMDARATRSRDIPVISTGLGLLQRLVSPKAAKREELSFKGGEPAVVYVRADGDADLDLYIYDEYNNLICSDEGSGHEATCQWRPRWTGSFLVDVRNRNEAEVKYVFAVNSVGAITAKPTVAARPAAAATP